MRYRFNLFLVVFISCSLLHAEEDERRRGVTPMAAPYYTPDTGWGIGAYVVTWFRPDPDSPFTTPDEISFYAACTEKKQAFFVILPDIYFRDGGLKLSGRCEVNKYPTAFWGVGPDTDNERKEIYTSVETWGDMALLFRGWRGFYAGPMLHYRFSRISDIEEGGIIETTGIEGGDGTREIGAGLSFQYDTRDSIFYPLRGLFIEGKGVFNREEFTSEYSFSRFDLDARWFAGITGEHVLAFQLRAGAAAGDVPLQSLCGIGGHQIMRGYMTGRYLDRSSAAVQGEYRFPVIWRFAGVIFAAAGEVQEKPSDYNTGDIHYSGGGGVRFVLDRSQHIAARLDCGVDDEGTANFYFLMKEAF